jgi:hypothetical protein
MPQHTNNSRSKNSHLVRARERLSTGVQAGCAAASPMAATCLVSRRELTIVTDLQPQWATYDGVGGALGRQ